MRQWTGMIKEGRACWHWHKNRCTQRAVHFGRQFDIGTLFARGYHFHATRAGTHHLGFCGVQDGRRDGHAYEKRKPQQHQTCDQFMACWGGHVSYYR